MAVKIVGMMAARNSAWVIGASLRAALRWCDEVIVFDHRCEDGTVDIIRAIYEETEGAGVLYFRSDDTDWREMAHRQAMLEMARKRGSTHLVYIDDDEILTGNLLPDIRGWIASLPQGAILELPWLQLCGDLLHYHSTGVWAQQDASVAFKDSPELHWAARDGYDFHQRKPMGASLSPVHPLSDRSGGLMHLQMVSERRVKAKAALYKMTEVLRWPGRKTPAELNAMYGLAVDGGCPAQPPTRKEIITARRAGTSVAVKSAFELSDVPPEWWEPYGDLALRIEHFAEPWQAGEVKRLLSEHGSQRFAGLDLYGFDND